jgi:acyl carrier protein
LTLGNPYYETIQRILNAERAGTRITVAQGDVGDENGMRSLFEQFGQENLPLRGIVHAALEMTSCPVREMDLELFQRMCHAKALGAWNLHRLTLDVDLDFFVLFSSTTALWGVSGLGHYAAANQALDVLAHWRREHGLPALSVNWGTWQEMRVASAADKERFAQTGLHPMPSLEALVALEHLLSTDRVSAIVASIDWNALRAVYEARRTRPLFSEMRTRPPAEHRPRISSKSTGERSQIKLQLQGASPAHRRNLLIALLRSQVSSILGFELSREIELEQGLFDMGMDSLMAMDLKGQLERSLDVPLPSTLTFNYPTIQALADYLLNDALGFDPAPETEKNPPIPSSDNSASVPNPAEDLSEDDLSALLLKRLEEME